MQDRNTRPLVALLFSFVACGGNTPPPETAVDTSTSATVEAPPTVAASTTSVAPEPPKKVEPVTVAVPTACAEGGGDMCVAGAQFADKVCAASQPDLALVLFTKGSPWTRLYLKGDVDAWNAEGGAAARAKLQFDEEVIVLKRRTPPKGSVVVVGSGGGYQVMRWDGNCYSLDEGEVTTRRPPKAKHPLIMWKYLTEGTRNSLLGDATLKAAYDKRGKECKGAMSGEVPIACEQADTALSNGVVDAVKGGLAIPFVFKTAP